MTKTEAEMLRLFLAQNAVNMATVKALIEVASLHSPEDEKREPLEKKIDDAIAAIEAQLEAIRIFHDEHN